MGVEVSGARTGSAPEDRMRRQTTRPTRQTPSRPQRVAASSASALAIILHPGRMIGRVENIVQLGTRQV
jgi:hypothetical protein